jgi:biopolymer transport protein ExbD
MAMSVGAADEGGPMVEMNTTPLIDVMLVLLIMFIITLPPATHAVKIDLPQDCKPNCPPPPPIMPDKNLLYIAPNDTIMWNAQPIVLGQLEGLLEETQNRDPIPELHLQPDPMARYEVVDKVLAVTKRAKVSKMGFIGNEAYRGAF